LAETWFGLGARADRRDQRVEINAGRVGGKIPFPQRHVERGVLTTHETRDANAVLLPERERKQQQRLALDVIGNDDERPKVLALADQPLPGAEEIETLIRGGEVLLIFEAAPDRLSLGEIADNIDADDAACLRPRWRCCPAFDRGSHGHCKTCL
jgi:hypothetical protein